MIEFSKDRVIEVIETSKPIELMHFIGNACVALHNRQTAIEQQFNVADSTNFRGFTKADSKEGSLTAKYYLRHGTLLDWQVQAWTRLNKRGEPRISKYWRQIDEEHRQRAVRAQIMQQVMNDNMPRRAA